MGTSASESQWRVGESRIIQYYADFDQPNKESQVEVKLVSIRYKEQECYRDKATPIAVFVTLRAENVGSGEASDPGGYISPYWRNPEGRRVDLDGCLTSNGLPESLAPGEYAIGTHRWQVPPEPGSLVVETAFPFVNSVIDLDPSAGVR